MLCILGDLTLQIKSIPSKFHQFGFQDPQGVVVVVMMESTGQPLETSIRLLEKNKLWFSSSRQINNSRGGILVWLLLLVLSEKNTFLKKRLYLIDA